MALRSVVSRGIRANASSLFTAKSSNFIKPPHLGRALLPVHTQNGFRYSIRAVQGQASNLAGAKKDEKEIPHNWKVKMLYDGECPLCMREVDMLRKRNEQYGSIKFVDISSDKYSPSENQDLDYPTAMGSIHVILADGTVVKGVEAFRKLYEAVGLGWVYAVTKYEPIATVANSVYAVWAKYRMQVTGRPPLDEVVEAKLKKQKVGNGCSVPARSNMFKMEIVAIKTIERYDHRLKVCVESERWGRVFMCPNPEAGALLIAK